LTEIAAELQKLVGQSSYGAGNGRHATGVKRAGRRPDGVYEIPAHSRPFKLEEEREARQAQVR